MKLLLNVTEENFLYIENNKIEGIIISIDKLSINPDYYLTIEQLIQYRDKINKKVIINLNANIHNKDINYLKDILIELETLNIEYIFYHDLAILNIVKELGINLNLVYAATSYITNYNIINFYNHEVDGFVLSNEIRREEIKEIRINTNTKLFLNIFGYMQLMATKRKLVSNYLSYIDEVKNDNIYNLEEVSSKRFMPIIENDFITTIYSPDIVNVMNDEVIKYIDYGVINLFNCDYSLDDVLNNKVEKKLSFLDKETIYKVVNKNNG